MATYLGLKSLGGEEKSDHRSVLLNGRHPPLGGHTSNPSLYLHIFAAVQLFTAAEAGLYSCFGKITDKFAGLYTKAGNSNSNSSSISTDSCSNIRGSSIYNISQSSSSSATRSKDVDDTICCNDDSGDGFESHAADEHDYTVTGSTDDMKSSPNYRDMMKSLMLLWSEVSQMGEYSYSYLLDAIDKDTDILLLKDASLITSSSISSNSSSSSSSSSSSDGNRSDISSNGNGNSNSSSGDYSESAVSIDSFLRDFKALLGYRRQLCSLLRSLNRQLIATNDLFFEVKGQARSLNSNSIHNKFDNSIVYRSLPIDLDQYKAQLLQMTIILQTIEHPSLLALGAQFIDEFAITLGIVELFLLVYPSFSGNDMTGDVSGGSYSSNSNNSNVSTEKSGRCSSSIGETSSRDGNNINSCGYSTGTGTSDGVNGGTSLNGHSSIHLFNVYKIIEMIRTTCKPSNQINKSSLISSKEMDKDKDKEDNGIFNQNQNQNADVIMSMMSHQENPSSDLHPDLSQQHRNISSSSPLTICTVTLQSTNRFNFNRFALFLCSQLISSCGTLSLQH